MSAFCFDTGTQPDAWNCFAGINLVTIVPSLICLIAGVVLLLLRRYKLAIAVAAIPALLAADWRLGRVCRQRHVYVHTLDDRNAEPTVPPTEHASSPLRTGLAMCAPFVHRAPCLGLLDLLRRPQPAAVPAAGCARSGRTGTAAAAHDLRPGPLAGPEPAADLPPKRRSTAPVDRTGHRGGPLGQPALAARAGGALGDCGVLPAAAGLLYLRGHHGLDLPRRPRLLQPLLPGARWPAVPGRTCGRFPLALPGSGTRPAVGHRRHRARWCR